MPSSKPAVTESRPFVASTDGITPSFLCYPQAKALGGYSRFSYVRRRFISGVFTMPDGSNADKTVSAQRLKQFIARIEKLEEEKKALAADIKEVYSEAKSAGFDVKIMRQVIKIRKMDKADREEQESLIEIYLDAVGE
jgi:uncharacterized protein (UPF0335 family)